MFVCIWLVGCLYVCLYVGADVRMCFKYVLVCIVCVWLIVWLYVCIDVCNYMYICNVWVFCVYVCMYVRLDVYVYVCLPVSLSFCILVCIPRVCVRLYMCMCNVHDTISFRSCMPVCVYVCVWMRQCMPVVWYVVHVYILYVCGNVCMCVVMIVCMRMYASLLWA